MFMYFYQIQCTACLFGAVALSPLSPKDWPSAVVGRPRKPPSSRSAAWQCRVGPEWALINRSSTIRRPVTCGLVRKAASVQLDSFLDMFGLGNWEVGFLAVRRACGQGAGVATMEWVQNGKRTEQIQKKGRAVQREPRKIPWESSFGFWHYSRSREFVWYFISRLWIPVTLIPSHYTSLPPLPATPLPKCQHLHIWTCLTL